MPQPRRLFRDPDVDQYIREYCSQKEYGTQLRIFQNYLQSKRLDARTAKADHILEFYRSRRETRSDATVAMSHTAIHEFYVHCFRQGIVSQIPTLDFDPPNQGRKAPVAAPCAVVKQWIEHLERFISKSDRPDMTALRVAGLVGLCAVEGFKIGSALLVEARQLHGSGSLNPLGLGSHTAMCLARIANAAPNSVLLFSGRDPERPITNQQARQWLRVWARKLDLPHVTYERLTQAFRREFLNAEGDVYLLSAALKKGGGAPGYSFQDAPHEAIPTREDIPQLALDDRSASIGTAAGRRSGLAEPRNPDRSDPGDGRPPEGPPT